jgi:hypothetical protein
MPFTNTTAAAYGILAMHAIDMFRVGGLAYTTGGARLDGRWVDDKSLHNRK